MDEEHMDEDLKGVWSCEMDFWSRDKKMLRDRS